MNIRGVKLNHRFPKDGKDYEEVKARVNDFKKKDFDFSSGRIFASMCTEPLDTG